MRSSSGTRRCLNYLSVSKRTNESELSIFVAEVSVNEQSQRELLPIILHKHVGPQISWVTRKGNQQEAHFRMKMHAAVG